MIGSAKRKKQFMILGGLCLLAILVIVAIVLSVMLINKDTKNENLEDIELDDILQSKLQPNRFNGTWIDDKTFYYFDVDVILQELYCFVIQLNYFIHKNIVEKFYNL